MTGSAVNSRNRDLEESQQARNALQGARGVEWVGVTRGVRSGETPKDESIKVYRAILKELCLDWTPDQQILPTHGNRLASS